MARAYLAGMPYNKVEVKRREDKEWEFEYKVLPRTLEMIKKYAPSKMRNEISMEKLKDWINNAG